MLVSKPFLKRSRARFLPGPPLITLRVISTEVGNPTSLHTEVGLPGAGLARCGPGCVLVRPWCGPGCGPGAGPGAGLVAGLAWALARAWRGPGCVPGFAAWRGPGCGPGAGLVACLVLRPWRGPGCGPGAVRAWWAAFSVNFKLTKH